MEARDFYFELVHKASGSFFLVTTKKYYDAEGVLSDESGVADKVLSADFLEIKASTYEYAGNIEIGRQILLDLGMTEISFGLQQGEPSAKSNDDDYEPGEEDFDDDGDEIIRENDIDSLLYSVDKQDEFDYKNLSTDKLMRHLNVMVSTDAFEEAAKIRDEINSRNVIN